MAITMQLNERLYTVSRDVDTIYKLGKIDEFLKNLHSVDKQRQANAKKNELLPRYPYEDDIDNGDDITFQTISSDKLKSEDCIMAHNLNPVTIRCGIYEDGSYYDVKNKVIQIAIHYQATALVYSNKSIKDVVSKLKSKSQKKLLPKEFTPERIKATISHELSHWIDDSVHNNFINNLFAHKNKFGYDWMKLLGVQDVNMTYFEIQGQIHGIKEAKRKHLKKWDTMTLADLFNIYPSLHTVHGELYGMYGYEVSKLWQTNLVRRMAREGLLGKNMRNFVK